MHIRIWLALLVTACALSAFLTVAIVTGVQSADHTRQPVPTIQPTQAPDTIYWAHCTLAGYYRIAVTIDADSAAQAQEAEYWPIPRTFFDEIAASPDMVCDPGPMDGTGW